VIYIQTQAIAVKGAIVRDGKVLTIYRTEAELAQDRTSGPADFPGGRLEYAEAPTEGLYREILEETGLQVNIGPVIHVWSIMRPDGLQLVIILYRCYWADGEVQLGPEHDRFEWVDTNADHLPSWIAEGVQSALKVIAVD